MEEKYIVYLTTNKINGHIYIGVHKTKNPDEFDHYLGEGAFDNKPSSYNKAKCHFHQALMKYGVSNFYRQTLKVFDNLQDALIMEEDIVTEEFVKRTNTYNMTIGGGVPPIHNKIIYEFDLNGNLIKKWDSIKSINEMYNCNDARIRMCINDKRSFNNSYWSFEDSINVDDYRLSSRGYIFQYDKFGNLINSFENATIASLKLDIDRKTITNAIFNRTVCHGYYFLRANEDINLLLNEKSSKKLTNITPIYRYNLNGIFEKEYKSISEATKDVGGSHGNIIRAIKNNRTCVGYRWSYIKSDVIKSYSSKDLKPVKIAQYDLDHNLIKIWDSVKECKKEFPCCQRVCRKERRSTNGYIFEYIS